jgi:hypothetical protein
MGEKVPPRFFPDGTACLLSGQHWNPLTDDGDCARLEAAAGIDVYWYEGGVTAVAPDKCTITERYAGHDLSDRQAARRLASTRAAAEVGRNMK